MPKIKRKYDLILLIDVLEHFTKKEGTRLIKDCLNISNNILVSTPIDIGEQEDSFDNPYEEHKYQWTKEDLDNLFKKQNKKYISNHYSLIGFFGNKVDNINNQQKENKRLIRESNYPLTSYPRRIYNKIRKA